VRDKGITRDGQARTAQIVPDSTQTSNQADATIADIRPAETQAISSAQPGRHSCGARWRGEQRPPWADRGRLRCQRDLDSDVAHILPLALELIALRLALVMRSQTAPL